MPTYPAVGDRIGRFRLLARLGAGAMGVVYEALEETLDRRVALKVIAPALAEDPGFRERFVREARSLASLDSPHVVQVHAHGDEDGFLYLATQLIPDGDLAQMLRRWGPAPLGQAAALVEQVAAGLADAHDAGLAHRDIKPANVLVRRRATGADASLTAYLSDFGIARRLDAGVARADGAATQDPPPAGGEGAGTPSYMAPELHRGAPAGATSDLYAVGCLLWVVLTGAPPFAGTTPEAVAEAHLRAPVPQLGGSGPVVEALDGVLRRALAKDPAERYQRADDLVADLRRVATLRADPAFFAVRAGRGGPAAEGAGSASAVRRGRRHALATAAGGLATAATVVAVVLSVVGGDGGPSTATDGAAQAFVGQQPRQILAAAAQQMGALETVRVSGDVRTGGDLLGVELTVGAAGDCDGTISTGDGTAQLRRVADDTWFLADEQFWVASAGAGQGRLIAGTVGDRWVRVPPAEADDLGLVCDLDRLLGAVRGADGAAGGVVLGRGSVGGRDVVRVDTGQGGVVASVAVDDPHHLLELDSGRDGSFRFSAFDRPFEVRAPARDQVVDLGGFGG